RHAQSADVRQGFVALEAGVDVMQSRSQFLGGEASVDAPQGVATSGRTSQPPFPEPREAVLFQRVQAPQVGPEHHQAGFQENGDRDTGLPSGILDRCDDPVRKTVDGLAIPDQAAENGITPCDRAAAATRSPRVPPAVAVCPDSPERSGGCALPTPWARTLGGACHLGSARGKATRAVRRGRSDSSASRTGANAAPRCREESAGPRRSESGANGVSARLRKESSGIVQGSSSDILKLYQTRPALSSKKRMRICSGSRNRAKL